MRSNIERQLETRKRIQLIHIAAMVLFLLLLFAGLCEVLPAEEWTYPSCCLVLVSMLWIPLSWKMSGCELFSPYILFATASVLFNAGRIILEVLQSNPEGLVASPLRGNTILCTIYLVAIAHGALHLGALRGIMAVPSEKKRRGNLSGALNLDRACLVIGGLLFIISFLPAVQLTRTLVTSVSAEGYLEGFLERPHAHGAAATFDRLAFFLAPACFFLLAGSRNYRYIRWLSTIVVVALSFSYFFEGQRQLGAMTTIGFMWIYHRRISRIPFSIVAVTGLIFIVIVMPVVHSLRVGDTGTTQGSVAGVKDFLASENPAVNALSEMGWTSTILAEVYERVPSSRSYDLGRSYFYAATTILPNLFFDIHPAYAAGTPDRWFADVFYIPRSGIMTYGFSYLAEAYLNFGIAGLVLIPMAIGFGIARLSLAVEHREDPRLAALVGSLLAFGLVYARSDTYAVFRNLVWYCLCPWLLTIIATRLMGKHRTFSYAASGAIPSHYASGSSRGTPGDGASKAGQVRQA